MVTGKYSSFGIMYLLGVILIASGLGEQYGHWAGMLSAGIGFAALGIVSAVFVALNDDVVEHNNKALDEEK